MTRPRCLSKKLGNEAQEFVRVRWFGQMVVQSRFLGAAQVFLLGKAAELPYESDTHLRRLLDEAPIQARLPTHP